MTDEREPHVIYMNRPGTESLTFHGYAHAGITWTGWAAYHPPPGSPIDAIVRLRFGLRGGAGAEIRDLWISGKPPADLGGHVLRVLPWARLEAAVNQPQRFATLKRYMADEPDDVIVMAPPPPDHSLWLRRPAPERQRAPRLRLNIPTDFRKPDAFYADVADRFMQLVVLGDDSPAEQIAAANPGVNATTVHRWVKEARNRGLLPAAPRGEKRGSK